MIIKKLNSMFHRHHRWLFGAFTVVIIVSFMGFLTPGQFGLDMFSNPENLSIGETCGEKVTYGDFRDMARSLEVFNMLQGMRQEPGPEQIFSDICILRAAERMGVTAGDKEVADLMKSSPMFQENGKFSMDRYQDEMKMFRRSGISEADVIAAYRDVLTIQKLISAISAGTIISPAEVENYYRRFNVGYAVKVAEFTGADFRASIKPDAAGLKRFFEENGAAYRISGKVTSLLVEFPFEPFRAAAEKAATEENLEKFFAVNIGRFMKVGDSKLPEYNAVAGEVKKLFIENEMREGALRRASDFAAAAYEAMDGQDSATQIETFRRLAAENQGKVIDGGTVDFDAESVGGITSPQLVQQLSETYDATPVTNAVATENAAYVGLAVSKVAERPATFNEVAKEVNEDYMQYAAVSAAREAAAKASAELAKITDPAARSKAFAELKNCKFKTLELSMNTLSYENFAVIDLATMLRPGAVSAARDTADGAILVELEKRIPADMAKFAEEREKYTESYRRYRSELALGGFWEQILSRSRFDQSFFQQR